MWSIRCLNIFGITMIQKVVILLFPYLNYIFVAWPFHMFVNIHVLYFLISNNQTPTNTELLKNRYYFKEIRFFVKLLAAETNKPILVERKFKLISDSIRKIYSYIYKSYSCLRKQILAPKGSHHVLFVNYSPFTVESIRENSIFHVECCKRQTF